MTSIICTNPFCPDTELCVLHNTSACDFGEVSLSVYARVRNLFAKPTAFRLLLWITAASEFRHFYFLHCFSSVFTHGDCPASTRLFGHFLPSILVQWADKQFLLMRRLYNLYLKLHVHRRSRVVPLVYVKLSLFVCSVRWLTIPPTKPSDT